MTDITPPFIHRFVPGTSLLTLLLLHGTGGDENALIGMAKELAPGAALLSPRGNVLEGTMPRFFRRIREGVFDEEDLKFRANELADFVEAAAQKYGFDPARLVALGYSNGAVTASGLLLLRPQTLAGAVLFRPMVPLVPDAPPDLSGVRVFVAAGEQDNIAPPENAEALVKLLSDAGAQVTLRWQTAGHKLAQAELEAARDWLAANFATA
jgi:predicted esterase